MQLWQSWLGAHMCDRTVGVDPKGSERGNSHGRHHPEKDPSRPANLETSVCEERDSAGACAKSVTQRHDARMLLSARLWKGIQMRECCISLVSLVSQVRASGRGGNLIACCSEAAASRWKSRSCCL